MTTETHRSRGLAPRRRALAISLLALAGTAAGAKAVSGRLRTCAQAEIPLKFDLRNAKRPGICVEIIRALQAQDSLLHFEGLERQLPLKRIAQELATARQDVFFSMIDTPERLAMGIDFLDQPVLYESRHQVAVRADDRVQVSKLTDIAALGAEGVVLVTHGTAYVEHLQEQPGLQISKLALSNSQNLKMLLLGRGRFFYHAGSTLRSQIALDGLEGQVRVLPAVFKVEAQRVAFSPKLAPIVRARIVAALRQLEMRGDLQRLRQRYGVD